jgi:DNA-binding MarR family transcriptional regulator
MSIANNFTELPLGRHFAVLGRFYYGALLNKLSMIDIDKHYSLLMILGRAETALTQQSLGEQLYTDKASMVRIVDSLVEKGYVERQQSQADRRCYHILLTNKVRDVLPHIDHAVKQLNFDVMNGLSPDEQAQFHQALCIISKNLNELPAEEVQVEYQPTKVSNRK